jgi:hypothetical protein
MSSSHPVLRTALRSALVLLATVSGTLSGQSIDRLEIHGSLNAAYGRADTLGVFGVPQTGTSDYRTLTLQGRYAINENDQIVAQLFNRRLGTSPLASAISDVTMQWAYWQHRAGDLTFKAGRNPLPRGLSNETRYIGTVHPFYRPSFELQQDAFDAVDGAVLSYRKRLYEGIELEQHVFGGGSENRTIATTSTGLEVRVARTENLFGSQTYLRLPVANARIGAYLTRYNFNQATTKGYRTQTIFSAEATPLERVKLETEHLRITGHGPNNDNRSGYFQGTFKVAERVSLCAQHSYTSRMLFFGNTDLNFVFPETKSDGGSIIYSLNNNAVLKFEHHWRAGWNFDTATPSIATQNATVVTLTPKSHARYYLLSLAASF